MRRRPVMVVVAAAVALWGAGAVGAATGAVPAASSWGGAIEVPGLGALNADGSADVNTVSCGSAGDCVVGGDYLDGHAHYQGFLVSEHHGSWGHAIEVPGLGALNAGEDAAVSSVWCGSAGNCAAGGDYTDRHQHIQGFVVSETNGSWGRAEPVPSLRALNTGGLAAVSSVWCGQKGNCMAGGEYTDRSISQQGFVVSERHGTWGRAIKVPGLEALNAYGSAGVLAVSCISTGNCAAGGDYLGASGHNQGFVVSERHGKWRRAIEVPGLEALSPDTNTNVVSLSCGPAGNCAAGGIYFDRSGTEQGFVIGGKNGSWEKAIEVPGIGALSRGWGANVLSVSCGPAGSCAAGGDYGKSRVTAEGFVVTEHRGRWGRAIEVPGLRTLNAGIAQVYSVSCDPSGNCAAGGRYTDRHNHFQGFVVSEKNGSWQRAIEVPGLGALNKGEDAQVYSVSCPPAGNCVASGDYTEGSRRSQGFVVSEQ